MSYNGWSNRETWLVNLWAENDEGAYSIVKDMVADCDDEEELADRLSTELWDLLLPYERDGFIGIIEDILLDFEQQIDWQEIAEHYWADKEDDEEEDE